MTNIKSTRKGKKRGPYKKQARLVCAAGFKKCSRCKETKVIQDYYTDKYTTDGLNCCCKTCSASKNKTAIVNRQTLRSNMTETITHKSCSACSGDKQVSEFSSDNSSLDGFQSKCKNCCKLVKKEYNYSAIGFVKNLLYQTKGNNARRVKSGRILEHTLTLDWVIEQSKRSCYLSGMTMALSPLQNWQMSLERLNDQKGYTPENTRGMCLEFQCSKQWTPAKFQEMFVEWKPQPPLPYTDQDLQPTKRQKGLMYLKRLELDNGTCRCNSCSKLSGTDVFKLRHEFPNEFAGICKGCKATSQHSYGTTLYGVLTQRFGNARSNAKKVERKKSTLTIIDLVNMWKEQNGLCAYSGHYMTWQSYHADWRISIERVDVSLGYTKANTCLICREFNGIDFTVNKTDAIGSGGWSRSKVDLLRSHTARRQAETEGNSANKVPH